MWLVRPRKWSVVVSILLIAGGVVLWARDRQLAAITSVLSGLAWLLFGSVPHATRHNAARIAGLTAGVTLIVTWLTAMLIALLYAAFAAHDTGARRGPLRAPRRSTGERASARA